MISTLSSASASQPVHVQSVLTSRFGGGASGSDKKAVIGATAANAVSESYGRSKSHNGGGNSNNSSTSRRFFAGLMSPGRASKESSAADALGGTAKRNDLLLLALHTLASLSIPRMSLIPLVQHSVMPYLQSDDYRVRRQAAITCARIISPALLMHGSRGPSGAAIEEVITSLLEVSVSDTSPTVRLAIIRAFTPEFYRCISQAKYAEVLTILMSDEEFDVKMEALSLLGRVSRCNPACLMPPIRQQLLHIVAEMRGSPEHRCTEEASLLLRNFLQFGQFHAVVRPFMLTVVGALPLHSDAKAATAALEALGELATVLHFHLLPFVDQLLPVVILQMLDSSSMGKQCAAVKALGKIVSSTGVVVRPYFQYPQLLPKVPPSLAAACLHACHEML